MTALWRGNIYEREQPSKTRKTRCVHESAAGGDSRRQQGKSADESSSTGPVKFRAPNSHRRSNGHLHKGSLAPYIRGTADAPLGVSGGGWTPLSGRTRCPSGAFSWVEGGLRNEPVESSSNESTTVKIGPQLESLGIDLDEPGDVDQSYARLSCTAWC
ncbi:hypothetical protein BOTBODRAFT_32360 [Botryobasidium botryosum FD-172 SS1]|uniref:Uncharacterized protein n=1 Tax=Botryobasidium botryosum (strain FD-172 SS1) TaxID=930990 RepID=A0A067MGF7_BOTB1|nr:hypothetical protein BOTBODRAFT_32360 [Botryobasidium botryosum FD-172 SS1]